MELQPYQPIKNFANDIYCVDGEWYQTAFKRRMTVVRLKDQSLVIFSAIQMDPKDFAELEALGRVSAIIVPNVFHDSEAPFYSKRYPDAKVFVPAKIKDKCAKRMRVTGTLEQDWPFNDELTCISFEQTLAAESVFIHQASHTLIVTDMAFNISSTDFKNPMERLIFGKWNGILDVFGPSKLTKYVIARNRTCVAKALREIAAHHFERVVMNHGRLIESDGKRRFLEGYQRVYGPISFSLES